MRSVLPKLQSGLPARAQPPPGPSNLCSWLGRVKSVNLGLSMQPSSLSPWESSRMNVRELGPSARQRMVPSGGVQRPPGLWYSWTCGGGRAGGRAANLVHPDPAAPWGRPSPSPLAAPRRMPRNPLRFVSRNECTFRWGILIVGKAVHGGGGDKNVTGKINIDFREASGIRKLGSLLHKFLGQLAIERSESGGSLMASRDR
ncbi:uncharacterized protein LOC131519804 [Neofelis nebulosa]|uniref:uncharacterized protein LOC131519804 n=1 Tax=Neofelis nebulosa TaxID=61452 RepID=UPI00272B1BD3|nr:uncharacterized protein LOC131519804 [Neofelis nebulosa]